MVDNWAYVVDNAATHVAVVFAAGLVAVVRSPHSRISLVARVGVVEQLWVHSSFLLAPGQALACSNSRPLGRSLALKLI